VRRQNFYETAKDRKKFWMNAIFSTPKEKLPSQKQSTYTTKETPMTKFKDEQSLKNPSSDLSSTLSKKYSVNLTEIATQTDDTTHLKEAAAASLTVTSSTSEFLVKEPPSLPGTPPMLSKIHTASQIGHISPVAGKLLSTTKERHACSPKHNSLLGEVVISGKETLEQNFIEQQTISNQRSDVLDPGNISAQEDVVPSKDEQIKQKCIQVKPSSSKQGNISAQEKPTGSTKVKPEKQPLLNEPESEEEKEGGINPFLLYVCHICPECLRIYGNKEIIDGQAFHKLAGHWECVDCGTWRWDFDEIIFSTLRQLADKLDKYKLDLELYRDTDAISRGTLTPSQHRRLRLAKKYKDFRKIWNSQAVSFVR
jgi:hypothetical protein